MSIGFTGTGILDSNVTMRSSCEVPQWSLWWHTFPEPIGRHVGLVVSNNNFNMQRNGVMMLVVTSNVEKSLKFPYNKLLIINGKQYAVNLDTVTYVKKSDIKISNYAGMVIDNTVTTDIMQGIGSMFDPTFTVDSSQYCNDSTEKISDGKITVTVENPVHTKYIVESVPTVTKIIPAAVRKLPTKRFRDAFEVMLNDITDDEMLEVIQYTGWDLCAKKKFAGMSDNRIMKILATLVKLGNKQVCELTGAQSHTVSGVKAIVIKELENREFGDIDSIKGTCNVLQYKIKHPEAV